MVLIAWETLDHTVAEDIGSIQLCALLESSQEVSDVTVSLTTRRSKQNLPSLSVLHQSHHAVLFHIKSPCFLHPSLSLVHSLSLCFLQTDGVSSGDFSLSDSEITFQMGTSRVCVDMVITDDSRVENSECLSVALQEDNGFTLGSTVATITFTDNGDGM